jgi:hypothetical protein
MKSFLISILLFFTLITNTQAYSPIDTNGLTDSQLAEIAAKAAQMKADAASKNVEASKPAMERVVEFAQNINEQDLDKFSTYGVKLGKVITGFIGEIGISIEQFLNTKIGYAVIALLIFHFFGAKIISISFAIIFAAIFLPIWIRIFKNRYFEIIEKVEPAWYSFGKPVTIYHRVMKDHISLDEAFDGILIFSIAVFIATELIIIFH